MNLRPASEIRAQSNEIKAKTLESLVLRVKGEIEVAVEASAKRGLVTAHVKVPMDMEGDTLEQIIVSLRSLGYTTTVASHQGVISPMYIEPYYSLNISWA